MRHILYSSFIVASVLIGCGSQSTTDDSNMVNTSSLNTNTSISNEELDLVSNTNNDFAFDIYRYIDDSNPNNFISSYSVFTMLNILLPGANGITKDEMLSVGNIDVPEADWSRYFNSLHNQIVNFLDTNNSASWIHIIKEYGGFDS